MPSFWDGVKAGVRKGVAEVLYLSSLHSFRHKGRAVILTYHRVLPEAAFTGGGIQPGMYVDTEVFEQHMLFLKQHFQVISLSDLLRRWHAREWNDSVRYAVITFDDGWLDNYQHAYPILRTLQLPATIFLPTDFVGTDEWFWPDKVSFLMNEITGTNGMSASAAHMMEAFLNIDERRIRAGGVWGSTRQEFVDDVIERCKIMEAKRIYEFVESLSRALNISFPRERVVVNWDEVSTMSRDQISFGSHSASHRILTGLCPDEIRTELEGSQSVLKSKCSNYVPVFCYPNGNTSSQIQMLVKECGYQAAMGVRSGVENRAPENMFDLRRISIHNDVTSTVPLYSMRLFAASAA